MLFNTYDRYSFLFNLYFYISVYYELEILYEFIGMIFDSNDKQVVYNNLPIYKYDLLITNNIRVSMKIKL